MIERMLIVGSGSSGRRHLRLTRELLPAARVSVVSRNAAKAQIPDSDVERFSSIDAALATRPDAAIVANPATMHVAAALPLVTAGVHVLVEKPLSATEAGIDELARVSEERGIVVMVGYNLRFLHSLNHFRDLLRSGRIGKVLSVRAEVGQWLPSWRPGKDYREGVSASAALGGGVLLELSHEIDYLRWLFGEVTCVRAVHLKQSDLEIDVEDTAHLLLELSDTRGAKVIATLNMDFVRRDATRTCTVIGSTGTMRWDGLSDTVEVFEAGQDSWNIQFRGDQDPDESYRAELRHFFDCVDGSREPGSNISDGLAVVRVVEAARLSAGSGVPVSMDRVVLRSPRSASA